MIIAYGIILKDSGNLIKSPSKLSRKPIITRKATLRRLSRSYSLAAILNNNSRTQDIIYRNRKKYVREEYLNKSFLELL